MVQAAQGRSAPAASRGPGSFSTFCLTNTKGVSCLEAQSLIRTLAVAGLATGALAVGVGSATASTGYSYSSPSYSYSYPSYSYSSYRDYSGYSTYGTISKYNYRPRTYSYTRPYFRPSTGHWTSGYWRSSPSRSYYSSWR